MSLDRVLQPGDLAKRVADLEKKVRSLETFPSIGAARTKGGTTYWSDGTTDQVVIGLESDGTYAVWVGSNLKIQATGPSAGQILGLVISSIAGALSVGGTLSVGGLLSANGGVAVSGQLSASDHQGASNVPTLGGGNGVKVWVQNSDPGGSAANGDLWFNA